jgi:ketosteroid isomerase-like protein
MWIAVLLLMAAAQQPPAVKLPPELDRVLTDYEKAWQAGDRQALSSLFAEDGLVLSPGAPFVRGREAIAKFYKPGSPLSLRAIEFATSGNIGYVIGAYTDKAGSPDRGKFTLIVRRDASGRWMIVSDMDNPIARK